MTNNSSNCENPAPRIDHTDLRTDASANDILSFCGEAVEHGFRSVCVFPCHVRRAAVKLEGTPVSVSAVIGFPHGGSTPAIKALEALECYKDGAQELDMVINIGAVKSGDYDCVEKELETVLKHTGECVHKIIVEIGLLTEKELKRVMKILNGAKPEYVKTSTGKIGKDTTADDVKRLKKLARKGMGVKAAGGIRDYTGAMEMFEAGASIIGTSAGVQIIRDFRKGFLNDDAG